MVISLSNESIYLCIHVVYACCVCIHAPPRAHTTGLTSPRCSSCAFGILEDHRSVWEAGSQDLNKMSMTVSQVYNNRATVVAICCDPIVPFAVRFSVLRAQRDTAPALRAVSPLYTFPFWLGNDVPPWSIAILSSSFIRGSKSATRIFGGKLWLQNGRLANSRSWQVRTGADGGEGPGGCGEEESARHKRGFPVHSKIYSEGSSEVVGERFHVVSSPQAVSEVTEFLLLELGAKQTSPACSIARCAIWVVHGVWPEEDSIHFWFGFFSLHFAVWGVAPRQFFILGHAASKQRLSLPVRAIYEVSFTRVITNFCKTEELLHLTISNGACKGSEAVPGWAMAARMQRTQVVRALAAMMKRIITILDDRFLRCRLPGSPFSDYSTVFEYSLYAWAIIRVLKDLFSMSA